MSKFKVLLLEQIHQQGLDTLKEAGAEVIFPPNTDEQTLLKLVRDVEGIIIRANGRITKRLMEHASKLKVVGRHGIGVENIDVEAATNKGVYVVNAPRSNVESVAEHAVGMMICLSKRMLEADQALRNGTWSIRYSCIGRELAGKKLGLVGFGRIGQRIANICFYGFGMHVLYYDPVRYSQMGNRLKAKLVTLEQMLKEVDYLSLNVPLTPSTRHLVGEREIRMMKPQAFLINTSRGAVIDEEALILALQEKRIAGAGLDVFEIEPIGKHSPVFELSNVIVTPHMAAHTEEAMIAMSTVALDVVRVLRGGRPRNPVNKPIIRLARE